MEQQWNFFIKDWYGWAPSITNKESWAAWFSTGECDDTDASAPKLTCIPPMKRRRLSFFAKMAIHVATEVGCSPQTPTIFASRHGDLHKTSALLENIADREPLSPTQFGLSVHNAVAGQFHIFTNNQQANNTVSAGENTLLMALIDSVSRLITGSSEEILLIFCDQPVPEIYQPYCNEPAFPHALALLLSKQQGQAVQLSKMQPSKNNPKQNAHSTKLNEQSLILLDMLSNTGAAHFKSEAGQAWTLSNVK